MTEALQLKIYRNAATATSMAIPIETLPPPPEHWLGHVLNRLAILTRERTYAALQKFDLAPRSFGILLSLANEPGQSQKALGRGLGLDRTTVSQLVEALANGGWIERDIDPADRRNFQLRLTAASHSRLRHAAARAEAVQVELVSVLPEERRKQLVEDLALLLKSMEDAAEKPN